MSNILHHEICATPARESRTAAAKLQSRLLAWKFYTSEQQHVKSEWLRQFKLRVKSLLWASCIHWSGGGDGVASCVDAVS